MSDCPAPIQLFPRRTADRGPCRSKITHPNGRDETDPSTDRSVRSPQKPPNDVCGTRRRSSNHKRRIRHGRRMLSHRSAPAIIKPSDLIVHLIGQSDSSTLTLLLDADADDLKENQCQQHNRRRLRRRRLRSDAEPHRAAGDHCRPHTHTHTNRKPVRVGSCPAMRSVSIIPSAENTRMRAPSLDAGWSFPDVWWLLTRTRERSPSNRSRIQSRSSHVVAFRARHFYAHFTCTALDCHTHHQQQRNMLFI